MTSSQSIYLGVDPTAKGLHIGHLVACRVLKRFHDMGVKCIALVGGATALIGDPSFKVQERSILSAEDVQENVKEIQKDMEHVLGSGGDDHLLFVNNYDWYKEMNVIDFLRDVGKNMRVQSMLAKDSVSKRINSENSMSFAEFAYQCLQSNDFLHLHQRFGCICQVGGSDQWGNITSGIDFVKRVTSHSVHGITVPLLTNSQGHKFGKSEGNAVWIDKTRTSNHDFYQFFLRTDDVDLPSLLRVLTDIPQERIDELLAEHAKCPEKREAQTVLAEEVMIATRSQEDLRRAKLCAELLFGERDDLTVEMLRDVMDELPLTTLSAQEMLGKPVTDFLLAMQFADSKKAAKRLIAGGGVRLNGKVVQQPSHVVNKSDLLDGCILPLRVGKRTRKFAILH